MSLFAPITPFFEGFLPVSDLHTLHFEQSGNRDGQPVIILHGGPGGGLDANYRRFFDAKKWHIIQFSQRGCGQSTPFAELRENTTWDLVADIEKLREHLGIESWVVFGGSWGSTLTLAYAQSHPVRCQALLLRGIFMLRKKELDWFYQEGASYLFPDAWQQFLAPIPEQERANLLSAYYKRLTSDDVCIRNEAAAAWSTWEGSTSKLIPDANLIAHYGDDAFAQAFARIECHYFTHGGFFETEDQLLRNVDKIRHIPTAIVQGRYDVVCPMQNAWELSQAWPQAHFHVIANAGHSVFESGICERLVLLSTRWVEAKDLCVE